MILKQMNTDSLRLKIELIYLLNEFIKDLENRSYDIKKIILSNKENFEMLFDDPELPKGKYMIKVIILK